MVTEDYFGLGEAWRKNKPTSKRPTMKNDTNTQPPDPRKHTANAAPVENRPPTTVETLLAEFANKKNDAPSFGDLYQRPHDGDTAKTSHNAENDDASLSSHESDTHAPSVTFANLQDINTQRPPTVNGDNSTAKSSTHYRLQRDKSRALAERSQEESRQLLETLRLEREEYNKAREELERLRLTNNRPSTITPSTNRDRSGTAVDSAGKHH